jgi:hypothetical protein
MNEIDQIPPEIGALKKLRILDLWGNNFGSLPDEIADLKELKVLDLRVISMSYEEQDRIKMLLPHVKIYMSKGCDCGF